MDTVYAEYLVHSFPLSCNYFFCNYILLIRIHVENIYASGKKKFLDIFRATVRNANALKVKFTLLITQVTFGLLTFLRCLFGIMLIDSNFFRMMMTCAGCQDYELVGLRLPDNGDGEQNHSG